jgi:2,5-furandicarboxylate decarboxylase 1
LENSWNWIDFLSLKHFLKKLDELGKLRRVSKAYSTDLEISSVLFSDQSQPYLFEKITESSLGLAGNLYSTSQNMKLGIGISEKDDLANFSARCIESHSSNKGHISKFDRSSWDYNLDADLTKLPILKHYDKEAGHYLTAGIVATKFPGTDSENLSFHRMLVLGKNKVTARIVPRHLDQIAKDMKESKVPVSIIIGPPPAVFLSASLQVPYGQSEYKIANRMMSEKLELQESEETDIAYPLDSEILLEGQLNYNELAREGPFVDLTGTYDEVREQPVITLTRMHYRRDSVYQAVLAGSREHALFMGLPQEIKIRDALSKSVPRVRGVNLTPASNGYFHCVISIEKANDGDGKTAIMNCFAASHPLKLVIAVDSDVDPYNLSEVEWAVATRFQADKGLVQINGARGSSLDPSSSKSAVTSKLGFDATLPANADKTKFERAKISVRSAQSPNVN